jgi:hypothetical protein
MKFDSKTSCTKTEHTKRFAQAVSCMYDNDAIGRTAGV